MAFRHLMPIVVVVALVASAYVYDDFCSGRVWALDELWLLRFGGSVLQATSL